MRKKAAEIRHLSRRCPVQLYLHHFTAVLAAQARTHTHTYDPKQTHGGARTPRGASRCGGRGALTAAVARVTSSMRTLRRADDDDDDDGGEAMRVRASCSSCECAVRRWYCDAVCTAARIAWPTRRRDANVAATRASSMSEKYGNAMCVKKKCRKNVRTENERGSEWCRSNEQFFLISRECSQWCGEKAIGNASQRAQKRIKTRSCEKK